MSSRFHFKDVFTPMSIFWGIFIGIFTWLVWIGYIQYSFEHEFKEFQTGLEWAAKNDQSAWDHAKEENTESAYLGYLSRNRLGQFADEAKTALQQISRDENKTIFVLYQPAEPVKQAAFGDEIRSNVRLEIIGPQPDNVFKLGLRLSSPKADLSLIHPRQVSTETQQAFWGISGMAKSPGLVEMHAVLEDYTEDSDFPTIRAHESVWFTVDPSIFWYLRTGWFTWLAAIIGAITQSYISHLLANRKAQNLEA